VGAISKEVEAQFGAILAPYLASDDTFFVISSDFCHWFVLHCSPLFPSDQALFRGTRFSYTFYYPEAAPSDAAGVRLSRSNGPSSTYPIYESITRLDHEAMDILTLPLSTATDAHSEFVKYLARTKNTICGRHPIGVLFGALSALEKDKGVKPELKWVRYEQSSHCQSIRDSSVSYASAYIRF
jgi:hypothetical protein